MENIPVKAGMIKNRIQDIESWQNDDAKMLQQHLESEPDPSSPSWVQWSVKKKMLEDALGRMQDRQQMSDKFGPEA
jgi:hypothetical protein